MMRGAEVDMRVLRARQRAEGNCPQRLVSDIPRGPHASARSALGAHPGGHGCHRPGGSSSDMKLC